MHAWMGCHYKQLLAAAHGATAVSRIVLKVTDEATDAPQTARAGQKIDRVWTGFASLDDAFAATQRSLA